MTQPPSQQFPPQDWRELLENSLQQAGRALDAALAGVEMPQRRRQPPVELPPDRRMDYMQFKNLLAQQARCGTYPRETPEEIDLGPLHYYLSQLWSRTVKYNAEYGRGAVINLASGALTLSSAHPGSEDSCAICVQLPLDGLHHYVLVMHSHLLDHTESVRPVTSLHLSDRDYHMFLSTQSLIGTLVISANEIALVLKTSSTPRHPSKAALTQRLSSLLDEGLNGRGKFSAKTWHFTRLAAFEFGCSLYRNSAGAPHKLRKVNVTEI